MNPWIQLERLEAWVEELRTTGDRQARKDYGYEVAKGESELSCCLRIANKVKGGHVGRELGAAKWLGLFRAEKTLFMDLNDDFEMSFHEIADVVIAAGITPLREALGLEPYEEDEE